MASYVRQLPIVLELVLQLRNLRGDLLALRMLLRILLSRSRTMDVVNRSSLRNQNVSCPSIAKARTNITGHLSLAETKPKEFLSPVLETAVPTSATF